MMEAQFTAGFNCSKLFIYPNDENQIDVQQARVVVGLPPLTSKNNQLG